MLSRYLYTVKVPYNELSTFDKQVNAVVDILKDKECKVVAFLQSQFGISPMYLVCSIVYESETDLRDYVKSVIGEKPKTTKKRKGADADE